MINSNIAVMHAQKLEIYLWLEILLDYAKEIKKK